jgi:chemotaxis protein MotB
VAKKKNNCPECPKCLPGWLVQFGDLMSLLLVFFVLLLSMATMDKQKVEEYISVMKRTMGFLELSSDVEKKEDKDVTQNSAQDAGSKTEADTSDSSDMASEVEEMLEEYNSQMSSESSSDEITISQQQNEFVVDVPSSLLFSGKDYQIQSKNAKIFIAKLSRIIKTMDGNFDIEVSGHTSSQSFNSPTIPRDNWDISALRAISVAKELIKNRVSPLILKVSAYGSNRPKSSNPKDNKRVEIRFVSKKDQTDTIEQSNFFQRIEK